MSRRDERELKPLSRSSCSSNHVFKRDPRRPNTGFAAALIVNQLTTFCMLLWWLLSLCCGALPVPTLTVDLKLMLSWDTENEFKPESPRIQRVKSKSNRMQFYCLLNNPKKSGTTTCQVVYISMTTFSWPTWWKCLFLMANFIFYFIFYSVYNIIETMLMSLNVSIYNQT